MYVGRVLVHRSPQGLASYFAAFAEQRHQLRSPGKELRRSALVDPDVSFLVGVDGTPWRAEGCQAQRIGCSPGRHGECTHWFAEELAEDFIQPLCPRITAVRDGVSLVGLRNGRQDFGRGGGRVVAVEAHARGLPEKDSVVSPAE